MKPRTPALQRAQRGAVYSNGHAYIRDPIRGWFSHAEKIANFARELCIVILNHTPLMLPKGIQNAKITPSRKATKKYLKGDEK
jgi:hypothetical protein